MFLHQKGVYHKRIMSGNGNGNRGKEVALLEQQVIFWQDYKQGHSYRQIADKYGVTESLVGNLIRKYIKDLRETGLRTVAEYRQVQIERIQTSYASIWTNVLRGRVDAINTMIRLMEREAKLLGLDAPTKVDISARIIALAQAEGVDPDEAIEIAEGAYRELASGT